MINGLKRGRIFALNTRATAIAFVASAPSPYTVSVGKATSFPSWISAAAALITASVAGRGITITALIEPARDEARITEFIFAVK